MRSEMQRYRGQGFRFATMGCLSILSALIIADPLSPAWAVNRNMSVPQAVATLQQGRQRWLEVDLSAQRLIAWEGSEQIYAVVVSAGTEFDPTLPGVFAVQSKHESTRMRGPGYDVPDVPFAMFYDGNYAIHGAYWHEQFGTPVSRGCINVAVNHAEWFFSWASVGTPVVVRY